MKSLLEEMLAAGEDRSRKMSETVTKDVVGRSSARCLSFVAESGESTWQQLGLKSRGLKVIDAVRSAWALQS